MLSRKKQAAIAIIVVLIASGFGVSLPKAEAASCNCVVMRMDDVQDYWINNAQTTVMDLFLTKNMKMSPALIMNYFGSDPVVVNKVRQGGDLGLFEYTIHGWNHVDYTTLSLSQQDSTLKQASDKLFSLYGVRSKIFIPPYNQFNTDTLQAMKNNSFNIISSSEDNDFYPFVDTYGITHIPATIEFGYVANGGRVIRSNSEVLSALSHDIGQKGYAVLYFHPQDFVFYSNGQATDTINQNIVNQFSNLMDSIKSSYNVVPFGYVASSGSGGVTGPTVSASPPGGLYNGPQSVTLTSSSSDSTIYYTTDGSAPTQTSAIYLSPIAISSTTTLKFFAKDSGGNIGPIGTEVYTIDTTPPTVSASPPGGIYNKGLSVTLTANEPATIYYTTNGSPPTLASSIYTAPISISSNTDLQFFAKDLAGNIGPVVKQTYLIDTVAPSVAITSPASGSTFAGGSVLTISGTSSDNTAISSVQVKVGNSAYVLTTSSDGYAHWSIDFTLPTKRGTTQVVAKAIDTAGNEQLANISIRLR